MNQLHTLFLILVACFTAAKTLYAEPSELDEWLTSEARAELITTFEDNNCRLTLTEISDILFDYDASEQHMYTERLILLEPEASPLSFPAVLVKSTKCDNLAVEPIEVSSAALAHAAQALTTNSCTMEITALETLAYPTDTVGELTAIDRRNIVSELYNRSVITFRFNNRDGIDVLLVQKITDECFAPDRSARK